MAAPVAPVGSASLKTATSREMKRAKLQKGQGKSVRASKTDMSATLTPIVTPRSSVSLTSNGLSTQSALN
jgi:hypothetical protein